MAENKRPIVYVARKLTYYNENVELCPGFYVSKAYLHFAGNTYNEDGTITKEFKVDFINRFEYLDKKDDDMLWDFHAETSDVMPYKSEVFKNYAECKRYVNRQNYKRLNTVGFVSPSRLVRLEAYKQVINYGAKLEEKFISLEEREQISEDIKSY